MENSRLLQVFRALTSRELTGMDKFIRSPYFNSNEEVIGLWEYIFESHVVLKVAPAKERAFKVIFPSRKYDVQKIRFIMNQLLRLMEKFLVQRQMEKHPFLHQLFLCQAFSDKDLEKPFSRNLQLGMKQLDQDPIKNAEHHLYRFQLSMEGYKFAISHKRIFNDDLQQIGQHLDNALVSMKLRYYSSIIAQKNLQKKDYPWPLLPHILDHVEKQHLMEIPSIGAYYYAFQALTNRDQLHHFDHLVKVLFDHPEAFPEPEIRSLWLIAINYCIRKLNDGDKAFAKKGLDLYQSGLQKGLLYTHGFLTPFTYRNIIALGLLVKEYDWVERFMYTYKDKLEPHQREDTFAFNLAKLEFGKRNLEKARSLLKQHNHKDLLLNLASKTLLLKVYYETKDFRSFDALLQSMEIFIRRNKIIGYHKNNYSNIIYFSNLMLSINPYDRRAIDQLKDKILQAEPLTEREWLIAQLDARH